MSDTITQECEECGAEVEIEAPGRREVIQEIHYRVTTQGESVHGVLDDLFREYHLIWLGEGLEVEP